MTRLPTPTSLDDPKPKGKQKVIRVRDALLAERKARLEMIGQECRNSANLAANIQRQAHFASVGEQPRTSWGELGANQGNLGQHIDALSGIVFGLELAIDMLNEILGESNRKETA